MKCAARFALPPVSLEEISFRIMEYRMQVIDIQWNKKCHMSYIRLMVLRTKRLIMSQTAHLSDPAL
jgi:hypothetical protein